MSAVSSGSIARSPSENCTRIKKLGYLSGKHMALYGERIEFVSDPFEAGNGVSVNAVSAANPAVRRFELPVAILTGMEDLFKDPKVQ